MEPIDESKLLMVRSPNSEELSSRVQKTQAVVWFEQ
jgi:hypothetical protein